MWIARDKDGSLWLYDFKPKRGKTVWLWACDDPFDVDYAKVSPVNINDFGNSKLSEVTWENSPLELIIKTEEQ